MMPAAPKVTKLEREYNKRDRKNLKEGQGLTAEGEKYDYGGEEGST